MRSAQGPINRLRNDFSPKYGFFSPDRSVDLMFFQTPPRELLVESKSAAWRGNER